MADATPPKPADIPLPPTVSTEGLPEYEPLTPEMVEDEAIRGDFVMKWAVILLAVLLELEAGCFQQALGPRKLLLSTVPLGVIGEICWGWRIGGDHRNQRLGFREWASDLGCRYGVYLPR